MRVLRSILLFGLLLCMPAQAAPTCQDRDGGTIRCGTPGAMPVGWKPSPQHLWEVQLSRPPGPRAGTVLEVILAIALLFAMIALLPKFDGSQAGDWDRQEGDEEDGR